MCSTWHVLGNLVAITIISNAYYFCYLLFRFFFDLISLNERSTNEMRALPQITLFHLLSPTVRYFGLTKAQEFETL
jgi:hypothetical protein